MTAMRTLRRRGLAAGVVGLALGALLSACGSGEDATESIGYVVDGAVPSYNANTIAGASSAGRQAFARTLGGFTLAGPDGNPVTDFDFGEAIVVPGDRLTVDYRINPAAKYSDGQPVVCDDLVLAWAAGNGTFTQDGRPLFDAATVPGMADIESIDCAPGTSSALVNFRPGRAVTDWRSLFSATTLMPAHVVSAGSGGAAVVAAVQDRDPEAMAAISQFWNNGFTLTPGRVDSAVFVSSGPYRLDSVGADGSVTLLANDNWWGDAPRTARIVVMPRSAEFGQQVADGKVQVVDVRAGSVEGLELGNGFEMSSIPANGVEQLTLSTGGVFESAAARRAFASCVPRDLWGLVSDSRLALAGTLGYPYVAETVEGRYPQPDAAASSGLIVRVGYAAPDNQRAQAVSEIAAACDTVGITVEDSSSPDFVPTQLRDGSVDAVLGGPGGAALTGGSLSDGMRLAALRGGAASNVGDFANSRFDEIVDQLAVTTSVKDSLNLTREAEAILWDELPSLPLQTQTRTVGFAQGLHAGMPNASRSGAGWNMDRWLLLK